MSTILNALKKAEPKPTIVEQRVGVDYIPRPKGGKRGSWKRGGIFLLVVAFLCFAGIGVLKYRGAFSGSIAKEKISSDPAARPSSRSSSGAVIPAAARSQVSKPQLRAKTPAAETHVKSKPVPPPENRRVSRQTKTMDLPRKTVEAKTRSLEKKQVPAPHKKRSLPSPSSTAAASPTKDQPRQIKPDTDHKDTAPNDSWKDASPLEDKKMKLQALAWSSQPGKRMVVIDGQVVREGDDVNGYGVAKIRKKDIILQKGEQYFKLAFKR